MKLRDMIRTKKNSMMDRPVEVSMDEERYPYGLQVRLESEEIEKLDIDIKKMSVDDKVKITAIAYVESVSQNKNRRGENKSLGLQITKMDVKKTNIK